MSDVVTLIDNSNRHGNYRDAAPSASSAFVTSVPVGHRLVSRRALTRRPCSPCHGKGWRVMIAADADPSLISDHVKDAV